MRQFDRLHQHLWHSMRLFACGVLLVSGLLPLSTRAQAIGKNAVAVDCAGVAALYAAIIEPQDAIKQTTADPSLSLGDQYAFAANGNAKIVTTLKALTVPFAAATATTDLIAGFQFASDSANDWAQIEKTTPYGSLPAFAPIYQAAVALSNAQHKLLDGYRERADLAASCGVGPGAAVAAGDCTAVVNWMTVTQPVVAGFWTFDKQFNDDAQKRREQGTSDPSSITIGGLMSPGESAGSYVYLEGLTLAVNSAPAAAAAINQALVDYLSGWTDLFALGLLSVWAGFLGQDATTTQPITNAYNKESTTLLTDYPKLQQQWATLASTCKSVLLLPDLLVAPDANAENQ